MEEEGPVPRWEGRAQSWNFGFDDDGCYQSMVYILASSFVGDDEDLALPVTKALKQWKSYGK